MKIREALIGSSTNLPLERVRRIGKLQVSTEMDCDVVLEAFHSVGFLPLESQFKVESGSIEYIGTCDSFTRMDMGSLIPYYRIETSKTGGVINFKIVAGR
jgi:hypothetical protein